MAPLKFEEHIKDELEQRKLQPSATAWQKLNNQLDSEASSNKNKTFWWLGIAASIVGLLLIVTVKMTSENKNEIPTLVGTEKNNSIIEDEIIKETIKKEHLESKNIKVDGVENEPLIDNALKESISKKPSLLKQKLNTEQNKLVPTTTNDAVAEIKVKQIKDSQPKKTNVIKTLTNDELKIKAVVAKMQKLQEQNKSPIDSELDALLGEAQKEIALEKLYNEAIKTVDADALLLDIEQDIDISFRDRVFKALKDSYKTVKTAVAERNN